MNWGNVRDISASKEKERPRIWNDKAVSGGAVLIIFDTRVLYRQCLAYRLQSCGLPMEILTFDAVGDWRRQKDSYPPASAVLINIGNRRLTDYDVNREISDVVTEFLPAPVVIIADLEELPEILKALECGAKAYIPSSICFEVCVEAISLSLAGGIFVPASSILGLHSAIQSRNDASPPVRRTLTRRQEEVAQALRRGKANRAIACELRMSESTVKVHIRNIMKKLNARNRTEVAFKLTQLVAAQAILLKADFLLHILFEGT